MPNKVDTENVTTSALPGKVHSEKVVFGKIEDSVDVIGKLQLSRNEGKFLLQNNNIEARTSTNANETIADGYCNHSSPGYGLYLSGVEQADMAVEYSPLDHSSTNSLHKGEPQNRHTGEEFFFARSIFIPPFYNTRTFFCNITCKPMHCNYQGD